MTGEGLRRLLGFVRRLDLEPVFLSALAAARKITRGPKPVRALREVGLPADEPTTEGYIVNDSCIRYKYMDCVEACPVSMHSSGWMTNSCVGPACSVVDVTN